MKKQRRNKILAINFGGIGDEILFFPTLKTLKKTFYNSTITLVTEPRSKSAGQLTNLVDDVITCDIKSSRKYLNVLKLLFKIWAGRYNLVVSSGSSKFVAVLLFLTGIKKRYGYYSGKLSELLLTGAAPLNQQQYTVDMYHDLVAQIAEDEKPSLPEIDIPAEDLRWASEIIGLRDKKVVLVHPGVSKMSIKKNIIKFWDSEKWIELIKTLLDSDRYKVILAGGPDDWTLVQEIRAELARHDFNQENFIDVVGKTQNIVQLAALIKMSDIMVCVDSAPMHIAVGTRTQTVAIFGPTDEKKLLPQNDSRFVAITNKHQECRPCLWDVRQTSCEHSLCLNITVDQVIEGIESFS